MIRSPTGIGKHTTKLPMGISVRNQGLRRVIDQLFSDIKDKLLFNFLDDLLVYSKSLAEHSHHFYLALNRMKEARLILNSVKIILPDVKYSTWFISYLPEDSVSFRTVLPRTKMPRPSNL
jgi:hypothetical protein